MDLLDRIVKWNKERGLIEKGFDHKKEVSFVIEELLESTGEYHSFNVKEESNKIASSIIKKENKNKEELVDSFADILVYATGAIAKLGYDPSKVLEEVIKEIEARNGVLKDGKWVTEDRYQYEANFKKCLFED